VDGINLTGWKWRGVLSLGFGGTFSPRCGTGRNGL
jgi:hypothetical protein